VFPYGFVMPLDLTRARELGARESGLAVVVAYRPDGTAHTSVVNAGVLDHPLTDEPVVAFVVRGHALKLAYLRLDGRATVVLHAGWDWVAVEGTVELAGPHDALAGIAPDAMPALLRSVYAAAVGGRAEDWSGLDAEMATEGHTAVLLRPTRLYGNAPAGEA
jgi:hypothetical protein